MAPGGIPFWMVELLKSGTDRPIELLNLAGLGETSIRVRQKARILADLDLDLLVVATGNNEYPVEPPPWCFRIRRHALIRLLSRSPGANLGDNDADLEGLWRAGLPDDELRGRFRANLESIADAAAERGVPLVLATLPINLLHGVVDSSGNWNEGAGVCARQVTSLLEAGDSRTARWVEAVASVASGELVRGGAELASLTSDCLGQAFVAYADGRHAQAVLDSQRCSAQAAALTYAGVALDLVGRPQEALLALEFAAETQPWFIRPSYNDMVRDVADSRPEVTLVNLEAAMLGLSAPLPPGPPLFVDSCHLHWTAYAQMASEIIDVLRRHELGPGSTPAELPSFEELAGEYGLTQPPAPLPPPMEVEPQWACPAAVPTG